MRQWWYRDHQWLGRFVEWRGNLIRLDGCLFDVSHPQISTALRGRLLRGRYERSERGILEQRLDPFAPVIELGGGIGVVATLVNRRLRDPASHVVVEANASLIPVLERQRHLNGARFTIEHAAIAYENGPVSFDVGAEFISGRIAGGRTGAPVPATTLASVLERHPWTGVTLICDIEGAETALVEREIDVLRAHVMTIVMEVHPALCAPDAYQALFARLTAGGFVEVARVRKVHAFQRRDQPDHSGAD
ncbi:MAG TPA: FkbM family methyltransferase [Vicinamibacterales bacterium]|nr:FkbM family methyltransferase [Vicinamibacterales bacterium]